MGTLLFLQVASPTPSSCSKPPYFAEITPAYYIHCLTTSWPSNSTGPESFTFTCITRRIPVLKGGHQECAARQVRSVVHNARTAAVLSRGLALGLGFQLVEADVANSNLLPVHVT